MLILISFLPILLFVSVFVGSGLYFTFLGAENAFYQISPLVAILPSIGLAWWLYRGNTEERMHAFLDGVRHRDIITMCIIFLLAGAFSSVTKAIGSVDSTVQLSLSLVPPQYLLIGLFLTSAFIATAIGTSMGTIATIAPLAAGLSMEGAFPASLGVATVVGGAMFGDNLSIVSDTTIAAVMSQEADMKEKLKLNAKVALIASIITIVILLFHAEGTTPIEAKEYSFFLIMPYVFLILLAISGINVFISLSMSILFAGIVGFIHNNYTILQFSQNITAGFSSMQDIMLLSLMVGGLSGLVSKDSKKHLTDLLSYLPSHRENQKIAQLFIAKMVSVFDILLANNTIAIIFSGEMARDIAKKYRIPKHYSAAWLDIFSCVFQGIIPYGAQILLAAAIAGVAPISVTVHVYYCYVLGGVAVGYILLRKIKKED